MATYKYSCNEERGEFHGHIEDENGNEVYSFHYPEFYEDENDGELIECSTLFDSGHMKHSQDVEGLEDYLKSINILHSGDELVSKSSYKEGGEIERGNVVVFKKDMKGNMAHRGRWKVIDVVFNEFGMPSYHLYSDAYGFSLDVEPSEVEKATFFAERFADGGVTDVRMQDTVQRMDNPDFADISFYGNGGGVGRIVMIPTYVVKEIYDSVKMGYDNLVEGMIGRKRKGVMLINEDYEVRGTYDIGLKDEIQNIIERIKAGNFNVDAIDKKYAKGGNLEDKIKKLLVAKESFDLPLEMAVYVPSTEKASQIIPKREFAKRIEDVQTYLSQLFGGFSSVKAQGGYESSEKGLIQEDVIKVVAFANRDGFEDKFNELMNRIVAWCKAWSQESIGFEFEGDLFYVSENAKFKKGGLFARELKHYTDEAISQRQGVADEIMKNKDEALGYSYGGGLDYDEAMQRRMILRESRNINRPKPEYYAGYDKRNYLDEKPYSPIKPSDLPLDKFLASKFNKKKKS